MLQLSAEFRSPAAAPSLPRADAGSGPTGAAERRGLFECGPGVAEAYYPRPLADVAVAFKIRSSPPDSSRAPWP